MTGGRASLGAGRLDRRLRLRFVQLALDDPVLTRRLKDRAPFAFQAAVGVDPTRGGDFGGFTGDEPASAGQERRGSEACNRDRGEV
jgi:hypothetical protein